MHGEFDALCCIYWRICISLNHATRSNNMRSENLKSSNLLFHFRKQHMPWLPCTRLQALCSSLQKLAKKWRRHLPFPLKCRDQLKNTHTHALCQCQRSWINLPSAQLQLKTYLSPRFIIDAGALCFLSSLYSRGNIWVVNSELWSASC